MVSETAIVAADRSHSANGKHRTERPTDQLGQGPRAISSAADHPALLRAYYSNGKMRFQSFFILMTTQYVLSFVLIAL